MGNIYSKIVLVESTRVREVDMIDVYTQASRNYVMGKGLVGILSIADLFGIERR